MVTENEECKGNNLVISAKALLGTLLNSIQTSVRVCSVSTSSMRFCSSCGVSNKFS